MQLYIKQRVFSIGNKFDINDEYGNPVYFCKSKIFSLVKTFRVFDTSNQEIILIKKKFLSFLPAFKIYINGVHEATINRKITFLKPKFYMDKTNWTIEGDFLAHNYSIYDGQQQVLHLQKRWFTWGDTYELSISDGTDTLLALASAIVIDCVCSPNNS